MTEEQVNLLIHAFNRIAVELNGLGTGNTGDPRGAIEFLAVEIRQGLESVAESINNFAFALTER